MESILNKTADYYTQGKASLGWELTVCNALDPEDSPCRAVLERNESYGNLLYDFLSPLVPMERVRRIIEVGGGYGYLMRDFLDKNPLLKVTMLDISPFLSEKQRETLRGRNDVEFLVEDFLKTKTSLLEGMDMAVLNENVGDFPTAVDIPRDRVRDRAVQLEGHEKYVRDLFDRYGLVVPDCERFPVNLGAMQAVEKLGRAGIPFIFLSEHSCEAAPPRGLEGLIEVVSAGFPEKINLKGHNEYTIRFSYLETIARHFRYRIRRGPLADFVRPVLDDRLRHRLALRSIQDEEGEIVRYFLEDLYKYEYLVFQKP